MATVVRGAPLVELRELPHRQARVRRQDHT